MGVGIICILYASIHVLVMWFASFTARAAVSEDLVHVLQAPTTSAQETNFSRMPNDMMVNPGQQAGQRPYLVPATSMMQQMPQSQGSGPRPMYGGNVQVPFWRPMIAPSLMHFHLNQPSHSGSHS